MSSIFLTIKLGTRNQIQEQNKNNNKKTSKQKHTKMETKQYSKKVQNNQWVTEEIKQKI